MSVTQDPRVGGGERRGDCREALAEAVLSHPSLFARLAAMASLWNPVSQQYEHALSNTCGENDVGEMLREWHQSVFSHWLSLSLHQKLADVAIFLAGDTSRAQNLRDLGKTIIPLSAMEAEREHFLGDLGIVQALVQYT